MFDRKIADAAPIPANTLDQRLDLFNAGGGAAAAAVGKIDDFIRA
jgi:hypothetical protein